jgi:hypothetical protein
MTIPFSRDERPDRSTARLPSPGCRRAVVVAICVVAMGCPSAEQIHTYNVPKETAPRVTAASPAAEPTDRMLTAILPAGDKAWFLKVVAPLKEINERADKLTGFFASVRIAAGKPHPDWQLPDGWEEQPGTGMRIATITIPTDSKPLELSVTSLPWTGTQADLLSNVNRWRGQMQLAPIGPQGLADCTRELAVGGTTLTIVDLRGRMQSTSMTPPFAAGGLAPPGGNSGSPGGNLAAPPSVRDLPAGHPPFAGSSAADQVSVNYESPDGWQAQPASGIRKAALRVTDGAREAMVTVIGFPAASGPMIADPLSNVNRWRSEVGLEPLAADDLSAATEPIEIAGLQASYVEAIPDASKSQEPNADHGTLAAMAASGDVVWFFKITGDRDLVVAQRDQFKSFLKSVRFAARDEPSNGD